MYMCVCMCVYVYENMHVLCVNICISVYQHAYVHMGMQADLPIAEGFDINSEPELSAGTNIFLHTHTCMHVCMYICFV
jgi:hypothetical protein